MRRRRRAVLLLPPLLLLLALLPGGKQQDVSSNEVEDEQGVDLIGDIIIHGEERRLSGTDRIAILRTQARHIRYTLISSEEECALKKFVKSTPVTRCELLHRRVCQDEFVLLRKPVRENCTERQEFCEAFHRTDTFHSETVFCEQKYDVDCSESSIDINSDNSTVSGNDTISSNINNSSRESLPQSDQQDVNSSRENGTQQEQLAEEQSVGDDGESQTCYPRRLAVCRTVPQKVTLTERKQKCNGESEYRTTKMCTTREDGSGGCVSFVGPNDVCDPTDEMKVINSELGSPSLQCSASSKMGGVGEDQSLFCFPSRCRLAGNATSCVRDRLPTKFEMKEVVCERCVEGRVKVRPVVETRNVCRRKEENFCLDTVDREVRWRKWCRKIRYGEDSSIRPRTASQDDDDDDAEKSKYHIELAPGRWVTTTDRQQARTLLIRQKEAEEKYPISYVERAGGANGDPRKEEDDSSASNKTVDRETFLEETAGGGDENQVVMKEQPRSSSTVLNEVKEDKDEETDPEKTAFRARISSCLFNPRKCRFR